MRPTEALAVLRSAKRPYFSTTEASLMLNVSSQSASQILKALVDYHLIGKVRRGHWALDPLPKPIAFASWVTAPEPAYVSLQTALHQHGLIQQIPSVIYVVSLAKTQKVKTAIGMYSVHQIAPALFGGFEQHGEVKLATAEKAVFDFLYLSRGKSGLFSGLPEVDLPKGFSAEEVRSWVARVPDAAVRSRVRREVERFLRTYRHDALETRSTMS
jgi:predicted transcriptional regulator of viral defense system